ncbi:MAG: PilZ domain-containing protein [Candidatus Hydrogenedentota bacterium]
MTSPLAKGKSAFLRYWEEREPVTILEVCQDTIAVTAPEGPSPAKSVGVTLEVPTLQGVLCYHTHVATAPCPGDEILLLRRSASVQRFDRRRTWRVPLHTRTKVSRLDEPRTFPALVVDVSAEGAQLHTMGPFDLGEIITFRLHLPEEVPHQVCAKVVRLKSGSRDGQSASALGVLFQGLSGPARKALTFYIWKRLQELFPRETRKLFRRERKSSDLDRRLGLIGTPDDDEPPKGGDAPISVESDEESP